jgi:hypothetical protein
MVLQIGSMAVKAVFNGAGLLSGLGKTSDKFKEVSQRSKSTTTEMKRMRGGAHQLRNALAAIGVGGFTALMMSAPQLAGSLAKIKYEMQQLAWSVGKHLKPALDAVATILQGIRTGDWATVTQGVKDLTDSLLTLADKAITIVVDTVFGEGTAEKTKDDFSRWYNKITTAWEEGDVWTLMLGAIEPVIWALERLWDTGIKIGNWLKTESGQFAVGNIALQTMPGGKAAVATGGFIARMLGYGKEEKKPEYRSYQVGGYVPQTGLYQLHAGETVTMKGSSGMGGSGGSSNITIDFSGANINLASGIELDEFADSISKKIAEKQQGLTY